jgi:acyl-CoA synthetase (AMP-forming)/AMP-acid ligase II
LEDAVTTILKRDISGWDVRWDDEKAREYVDKGIWPNLTVGQYALLRKEQHPEKIQIIDGDRGLTCRELVDEALAMASALIRRGLKPGDVISFQLPNWYEANVINLAASLAGLVITPIVAAYRDAEVGFSLDDSGSKILFIPSSYRNFDYVEMARRLRSSLRNMPEVVVLRGDAGEFTKYHEFLADGIPHMPLPPVDPDAVKLVLYTSGTTGRSKGVLHTHNTIHAENYKTSSRLGLTPENCTFNPSPVTHVTGAIYALNLPWYGDIKAVLMDTWEPALAFERMQRHECTVAAGATPFLQGLVKVAEARGETLPLLRYYICGGAAVPPTLIYKAAEVFPNCIPYRAYGMTEVPSLTFGPHSRSDLHLAAESDGEIWMGEIKVVDLQHGEPLEEGEEGEFLVRSPNMALGYTHLQDNDAAYDADGFFRSGDLGKLVIDGRHVLVTDRKKDIIIRSGENISSREIEEILLKHEAVAEIAVVSMPSEKTGEAACAFIATADGVDLTFRQISEYLEDFGLARQKTPEHIVLLRELPRTSSGKVRKDVLRKKAAEFLPDRAISRINL